RDQALAPVGPSFATWWLPRVKKCIESAAAECRAIRRHHFRASGLGSVAATSSSTFARRCSRHAIETAAILGCVCLLETSLSILEFPANRKNTGNLDRS